MFQNAATFAPRRALRALTELLRDPDDLPKVFTVIESLSGPTQDRMLRRLRASATGATLLRERADIRPLLEDREALRRLPEGSLGRAYLAFMESEGITAGGIVSASAEGRVRAPESVTDRGWLEQRMRDTHDLWHAVTGYKGDVLGEAALLGFTLAQTKNPGVGLIVLGALLKTHGQGDGEGVGLIVDGFMRGRRAAWFVDVEWERLLTLPVEEVRARLGVDAPPVYTPVRAAEVRARAAA